MLIGQFDSPFTRRVGITMRLYGLTFEHRPWSVFGDADKIRNHNPLLRVPTLVLANGTALVDSATILDYVDGLVPPAQRLVPVAEPLRHQVLRVCALASGIGDKAVALFYEQRLHDAVSPFYVGRCEGQIRETLAVLNRERSERHSRFWFGDTIGQADISVACILRHLREAHPALGDLSGFPALASLVETTEAIEVFQEIAQPFIAPAA